jgi:uncharacterized protein YkwD
MDHPVRMAARRRRLTAVTLAFLLIAVAGGLLGCLSSDSLEPSLAPEDAIPARPESPSVPAGEWDTSTVTPESLERPESTATPPPAPTKTPREVLESRATLAPPIKGTPPKPPAKTKIPPTEEPVDSSVFEVAALISLAREDEGVAELDWSLELEEAAVAHANDMSQGGFVSHTGSDGSDLVTRMKRAGYAPAYYGEIIAWVSGGAEAAFDWWWDSELHRSTMLGPAYREFGVGRAPHPEYAGQAYFVVVFGRE